MSTESSKDPKSVYDFTLKDAKGDDVDLATFKGKVLLIVNVASKCYKFVLLGWFSLHINNLGSTDASLLCCVQVSERISRGTLVRHVGMTNSNYVELNQLYDKYKHKGLEILAFPCNQFGEEEPGSNDQIMEFVCTRFKSEFPIFYKIEVNGDNSAPLYKFLKSGKWGIFGDDIQWNFAKFLVDKEGQVVDRYYPTTSPLSLERDIQKLLDVV